MKPRNLTEEDLKVLQANMRKGIPRVGTTVKFSAHTSHATNTQLFFVPGPLPGANDIIRKHHMVYSRLKTKWGLTIARIILLAGIKPVQTCKISFLWQEKNNRRDDDNVMFGQKFVLDALRDMQIIHDDRRQFVKQLIHEVVVFPSCPGVLVTIEPVM